MFYNESNKTRGLTMNIYEAVRLMREGLNNCAYEFTSITYQDRCESISVSNSGNSIYVEIRMRLKDPYYKEDVKNNIENTIDSLATQYSVNYDIHTRIYWIC